MPRPFAVIGFTVFFTIALLYNCETKVTAGVLVVYAVALSVSFFVTEARKQRVLPCAFASGILACILLLSESAFYYQPSVAYDGKTCNIIAQLTDYHEYRYGNYYFNAETVEIDGEEVRHKLRLVFSTLPDAEAYDLVEGEFTFYVLGSSSEEYLASNKAKGIFIGAYPKGEAFSVKRIPESEKPLMKKVVDARRAIKNAVNRVVPGDCGALLTALIIGDKSGLSAEIMSNFRMSGITHIICVSGFHLSLWAMVILEILRFLKINERIASIIAAIGVVAFMLVAGMTYSVIRSGIMMLLYLLANVIWKKRDSLNSLGFALTVIALYNPFAMGSVGLQLSALSTLGLILYSQHVKPKIINLINKIDNVPLTEVLKSLTSLVCVPIAATSFTVPVSLQLYDEFNFAVLFSNLLAVPVASFCMVIGVMAALSGLIPADIFNPFAYAADFTAKILLEISRVFSEFDLFVFRADNDSHRILISGILLVCAVSVFIAYSGKNLYKITCALCVVMFVAGISFFSVSRECETRINIIDVGNGTAVLASKNGENILIGCGGTEFLGSVKISDEIINCGGSIDAIFVSDEDRYSASYLNNLLMQYRPGSIYCNDLPYGSNLLLNGCDTYRFDSLLQSENFTVKTVGNVCAYLKSEDMSALICFDPVFDFSGLPSEFRTADIIISRNDYPLNINADNCKLVVINSENPRGVLIQKELSDCGVKCVATGGCGNILIRGENGYVSANRK